MPSQTIESGRTEVKAASTASEVDEVSARQLFERQKAYFATDATKAYEWRIEQLDRLSRMLSENYERFSEASRRDFKTAFQEHHFEIAASIGSIEFMKSQVKDWMKPVEAPVPRFLRESGHKAIVYREPYGVTLIICPFNGPVVLSSGRDGSLGAQPLHSQVVDRHTCDERGAARADPKVLRA
jgi:acyl-CoA reductase-like NAD-dependent aldehyde dehydrogenase